MYRILVVDDDLTSLIVAKASLKRWNYEVMAVTHALEALSILGQRDENEKPFDMVLADVHMPVMDGFQLLRHVNTDFNIPVVLISANDKIDVICKGLRMGAQAYLVKPIKADDAKVMWRHAESWKNKQRYAWRGFNQASIPRISIFSPSDSDTEDNPTESKTRKTVWNSNLHNRFVEVMLILGPKYAVPRNIVKGMNVPTLTREKVASHLQKFRKFLDKVLDGRASLDQTSKRWIDCNYYSSIVRGNPNLILLDQLQEKRRTGKWADPIPASLPLPQYNEAETSSGRYITMLMPNNYSSTFVNVATLPPGLGGVSFQSDMSVATPAQGLGGVPFESAGNMNMENQIGYYQNVVVPQQNHYFTKGSLIGGANNNIFPSTNPSAPSSGTAPVLNKLISEQEFNVGSQGSNIFFGENNFNANLQVGNVQLPDPNTAVLLDGNQFGNPLEMNQQLGNVLDPNIAIEFGNAMPMIEQAPELGGVHMADESLLIGNSTGGRDDSILGFGPDLSQMGFGSVHLDPNIGSSSFGANMFRNASAMPMNDQAPQLGGGVGIADGGCSLNDNITADIPAAAHNSLLGCDANLIEDWGDLFESLRNMGDDQLVDDDSEFAFEIDVMTLETGDERRG